MTTPEELRKKYGMLPLPPEVLEEAIKIGILSHAYLVWFVKTTLAEKAFLDVRTRSRWIDSQDAPTQIKLAMVMQSEQAVDYLATLLVKNGHALNERECMDIIKGIIEKKLEKTMELSVFKLNQNTNG